MILSKKKIRISLELPALNEKSCMKNRNFIKMRFKNKKKNERQIN